MPSITITTDATQGARLASAVGKVLDLTDASNMPRDATLAEVKSYIVKQLQAVVRQQERQAAEQALPQPGELVAT